MEEQTRDITRDILRDARRLASAFAGRTKRHTDAAVHEVAPAGGLLGIGLLVASLGGVLLLTTPIVPSRRRRVRRRLFAVSALYLIAGGTAAAIGGVASRDVLRARARHAARDFERGTKTIRHEVEREMG